jgi:hypothetical protein
VEATLCGEDRDFFRFDTVEGEPLSVSVTWPPGPRVRMRLFRQGPNPVSNQVDDDGTLEVEADAAATAPLTVELRLLEGPDTGLDYTLTVDSASGCVDDTLEDNDNPPNATEVQVPFSLGELIACPSDVDIFRAFWPPPRDSLQFTFDGPADGVTLAVVRGSDFTQLATLVGGASAEVDLDGTNPGDLLLIVVGGDAPAPYVLGVE